MSVPRKSAYYDRSQYKEAERCATEKGIFINADPDCVYLAGYDSVIYKDAGWDGMTSSKALRYWRSKPLRYWLRVFPEIFEMGIKDAENEIGESEL